MVIKTKNTTLEEWVRLAPKAGESIAVYAMSNTARRLIPLYLSTGIKIICILDRDPALNGTFYNGIPIISPDEFSDKDKTIIICLSVAFMPVLRRLRSMGFKKILPYYFYLLDKEIKLDISTIEDAQAAYFDNWMLSRPANDVLDYVDIPVTMKCSLRCRDCANLMQYFSSPRHADFETMRRSIEKLFAVIDHIFEVRVLGGEPFMYAGLYRYIEIIKNYSSKYTLLTVFTNATIIPSQKNLDALKDPMITLQISDYNNPRQKIPELLSVCEKNGILTKINKGFRWQDSSRIRRHGRTDAENMELLRKCVVHRCAAVVDGKLFYCPIAGNIYTLKAAPEEYHEFVPLLDDKALDCTIKDQINKLMRTKFLKICDFCGGRPLYGNDIPAAVQTDKALEYEKYGDSL
ncbi:MAG: 4Fe-4S cluster-binding domain-containing protein [Spirochaetaceae bacterium]|jgi:organic radical activating enzyme|nr:4Fe-4S cluster-binding domain-containing protein [Spirochaetaceae bacterium]